MGGEVSKSKSAKKNFKKQNSSKVKQTYLTPDANGEVQNSSNRPSPNSRPEISDQQKELVKETWAIVQKDMSRIGIVMFMKLFETHPDVQNVFTPFQGLSTEELQDSAQLKSHALRVMSTVEKAVSRLDTPTQLLTILQDLGSRHVMYNAKVDYMDLIGPQFIYAIEPVIGDKWTVEVEEAWAGLFRLISHVMKEAMVF